MASNDTHFWSTAAASGPNLPQWYWNLKEVISFFTQNGVYIAEFIALLSVSIHLATLLKKIAEGQATKPEKKAAAKELKKIGGGAWTDGLLRNVAKAFGRAGRGSMEHNMDDFVTNDVDPELGLTSGPSSETGAAASHASGSTNTSALTGALGKMRLRHNTQHGDDEEDDEDEDEEEEESQEPIKVRHNGKKYSIPPKNHTWTSQQQQKPNHDFHYRLWWQYHFGHTQ